MLSVCNEWINYHQKEARRWAELKSLMMGNREIDLGLD